MWKRVGLYYTSEASVKLGGVKLTVKHKLFFITYLIVKWFYGASKLEEMSAKSRLDKELEDKEFSHIWH